MAKLKCGDYGFECDFVAEGEMEQVIDDFRKHTDDEHGIKLLFRDQIYEIYEESVKARMSIIPAVEKIIKKEIPILSATMKKFET